MNYFEIILYFFIYRNVFIFIIIIWKDILTVQESLNHRDQHGIGTASAVSSRSGLPNKVNYTLEIRVAPDSELAGYPVWPDILLNIEFL